MRLSARLRPLALAMGLVAGLDASPAWAGGEVIQWFPAELPIAKRETQWRIVWGIERNDGGGEILFIKGAYFKRGPLEDEIQVLGDCRLSEIFVGYNSPKWNFFDIADGQLTLLDLAKDALGPSCLTPGRIYDRDGNEADTGLVVAEVHDDHVRWIDYFGKARRGQSFYLWSVLGWSNYNHVMLYEFRDDGLVGLRLGATGFDFLSDPREVGDSATHVHVACWRINLALGDAERTRVLKTRLDTRLRRSFEEELRHETRFKWEAEEFTGLRVESRTQRNKHDPAHFIGYDLTPMRNGSARYFGAREEFTHHDYWVTRADPIELKSVDLPEFENGEEIEGRRVTLWYQTPAHHKPRDEDFGSKGAIAADGLAITRWAVVELKPRNFFSKTPLYDGP